MGKIFNADFKDFLEAFNNHEVRYILVGGFSVILHGYPRTTDDMEIWVDRTAENYRRIKKAFEQFQMPVFDMTEENFLRHLVWDVFTFGSPPVAIDIMIKLKGLNFANAFNHSIIFEEEGLKIRTLHKEDLIIAKKAAGRAKDINDIVQIS